MQRQHPCSHPLEGEGGSQLGLAALRCAGGDTHRVVPCWEGERELLSVSPSPSLHGRGMLGRGLSLPLGTALSPCTAALPALASSLLSSAVLGSGRQAIKQAVQGSSKTGSQNEKGNIEERHERLKFGWWQTCCRSAVGLGGGKLCSPCSSRPQSHTMGVFVPWCKMGELGNRCLKSAQGIQGRLLPSETGQSLMGLVHLLWRLAYCGPGKKNKMPRILQRIQTPHFLCLPLRRVVSFGVSVITPDFLLQEGSSSPWHSCELMLVPEARAGSYTLSSTLARGKTLHGWHFSFSGLYLTPGFYRHRLVARSWAACSDLLSQAVPKGWVKPTLFCRLRLLFDVSLVAIVRSLLRVVLCMCFCRCGVTSGHWVHTRQSPVVWWWSQVPAPCCLSSSVV